MTVRRVVHLRLCVGAVLLSLPVAATSTTAVSGTPAAAALPVDGSATALRSVSAAAQPFGGLVAAPAAQLDEAETAGVARRVRVSSKRQLRTVTPQRQVTLDPAAVQDLDIPSTALAAYQIAATTMTQADPACGVDWTLLAAIGRIETDHGRHNGSQLKPNGISRPLIRGVALDGKGPVAMIRDSDGGRLDGDKVWDRAVGPMQFLPTTWGYAGVDADGDGVRSPDNINDAALAAAVFLCAAPGRLDEPSGVRTAVHRYNPSKAYVDLVVRVTQAYRKGNLAQLATSTTPTLQATQLPGPDGSTVQAAPPTSTGGGTPSAGDRRDRGQDNDTRPGGNTGAGKDDGSGQTTDGKTDGNSDGKSDTRGADLKDPVKPLPDTDGDDDSRPGFGGKSPDPEPEPEPDPTPDPTPEPEPEPVLAELTGILTVVEDVPVEDPETGEEVLVDQWYLEGSYVDEVLVDPILLEVGDVEWLAEPALADFDDDGNVDADGVEVLESNLEELTGLVGAEVVVTVEEDTDPAVVHAVNGVALRLPVE